MLFVNRTAFVLAESEGLFHEPLKGVAKNFEKSSTKVFFIFFYANKSARKMLFIEHKKKPKCKHLTFLHLAESEGFEPPEPRSSTVFKTAAIDHSANSPPQK